MGVHVQYLHDFVYLDFLKGAIIFNKRSRNDQEQLNYLIIWKALADTATLTMSICCEI